MLTATEILFIRDLIQQLAAISDSSEYTQNEIEQAMELLNRLQPIETESVLDFLDSLEE